MRKKLFLAATMALAMTAFAAPAFADDNTDLQALIDSATSGTVTLDKNYTITDTIEIDDGITINGNGNAITLENASAGNNYVFNIDTTDAVSLNQLTLNATGNDGRGIYVDSTDYDLTLDEVTLNVNEHGIITTGGTTGSQLTVTDSKILNSNKPADQDYDSWAMCGVGDYRGISLFQQDNTTVTITNSEIKGFGYSINVAGNSTTENVTNMTLNLEDSEVWGWSAFNVWTIGNEFNIQGSDLRGINVATGGANNFGTIVLNKGIYGSSTESNVFNIEGGKIGAYKYGANDERPIVIRDELRTVFNFDEYDREQVYVETVGTDYFVFFDKAIISQEELNAYYENNLNGLDNCDFSGIAPLNLFGLA